MIEQQSSQPSTFPVGSRVKVTPGKRALDLLLGCCALIALAPLMAMVAAIVWLDSPGPILFAQRRIGRAGVPFTMWKFRSMQTASSDAFHRQQSLDWFNEFGTPDGYKSRPDARITRAGRFLRSTSLDELPQLFNVLRGEMGLVGPRPLMPYDRPWFEPWQFEREAVRPGLTGLWQVSGRDRISAQVMMRLDVRYVREWSLWLDLKILAKTMPTVISHSRRSRRTLATVQSDPGNESRRLSVR